jgi:Cu/Zn superoxide dismutase
MKRWLPLLAISMLPLAAAAAEVTTPIHLVDGDGVGAQIGTVTFADGTAGLTIRTDLSGLPPGPHGFHIHENASCDPKEQDGKKGARLGSRRPLRSAEVPGSISAPRARVISATCRCWTSQRRQAAATLSAPV